jgi:MFS family permease
MLDTLKTREYRLLWAGQGISHLGDQFHVVALPFLVFTLTPDPLQLGIVMALAGIPRAVLMLVGGAFADRHSPRTIMLVSDAIRFLLSVGLAVACLTGTAQLWMVYALALAFGIVSGFFLPAAEAALPRVLEERQLEGGNALMMAVTQVAGFVGPMAAGSMIALFGQHVLAGRQVASMTGIGVAFGIDAVSFAVSAACLLLMAVIPALGGGADQHPLHAVGEGLRFMVSRPGFRWMMGMTTVANFMLMGPLTVGVPVLAQSRWAEGIAGYGFVLAAYAIGNLGGMVAAGSLPRPRARTFSAVVVGLFIGFGVVIASLAFLTSAWVAVALMVALGLGNGYIAVTIISLLQRLTPKELLGRVMSALMLAMVGLAPISQAAAGVLVKLGAPMLFVPAGAGIAVMGLAAALRARVWSLDTIDPPAEAAEAVPEPA